MEELCGFHMFVHLYVSAICMLEYINVLVLVDKIIRRLFLSMRFSHKNMTVLP